MGLWAVEGAGAREASEDHGGGDREHDRDRHPNDEPRVVAGLARSLERFGADDVEVNLLSARALEDPQTLIDISWFA